MQYGEGRGWSKDRRAVEWDHFRSTACIDFSVICEWEHELLTFHIPLPTFGSPRQSD
jgi:hypothetical protein